MDHGNSVLVTEVVVSPRCKDTLLPEPSPLLLESTARAVLSPFNRQNKASVPALCLEARHITATVGTLSGGEAVGSVHLGPCFSPSVAGSSLCALGGRSPGDNPLSFIQGRVERGQPQRNQPSKAEFQRKTGVKNPSFFLW